MSRCRLGGPLRAAIAVLLGTALTASPAWPQEPLLTFGGSGCVESVHGLVVLSERLRGHAPARFLAAPAVLFNVNMAVCERFFVGDQDYGRVSLSDVGFIITSPDGSQGLHEYYLWQAVDHPGVRAALAGVGLFGASVQGMTTSIGSRGIAGDVPWHYSPYRTKTNLFAAPSAGSEVSTWWHETSDRVLRIAFALNSTRKGWGVGVLKAGPDSPLAAIIGGERVVTSGPYIASFDFTATVTEGHLH